MNFQGNGSKVTQDGVLYAATKAQIEPRALKAVTLVETRGRAWDKEGRVAMLFEPHVFYRLLKDVSEGALGTAVNQGIAYRSQGEKPYPADSYPRLQMAMNISTDAALMACSWGAGQLMGENFELAGYSSVSAMVADFVSSADAQIAGMAEFIEHEGLNEYLNKQDWKTFARLYNGKNYAKNKYDTKLKDAYAHLGGETIDKPDARVPTGGPREEALHEVPLPPRRPADLGTAKMPVSDDPQTQAQLAAIIALRGHAPAEDPPTSEDKSPIAGPDADGAADIARKFAPAGYAFTTDVPAQRYNVKELQTKLRKLGYFESQADGDLGRRSERAILAFRNEHALPTTAGVDATFLLALAAATPPPPPASRAGATAKSLRPESTTLQATARQKVSSALVAIPAIGTGIVSKLGDANDMLGSVREAFSAVPGWAYGAALLFAALMIYLHAHTIEQGKVRAFKEGRNN